MSVYGFIGTGNMGGALAEAVCRAVGPEQVLLNNRTAAKAEKLAERLGCTVANAKTVAAQADYLFIGVKPNGVEALVESVSSGLSGRGRPTVLVSMAAGITIENVRKHAPNGCPVIRIMPNTPCSVGEGMILYACSPDVTDAQKTEFLAALSHAGRLLELPENLIDAGSAVSGCGPAFVFLFLQALADGGVACGLSRAAALELAAQTVRGSAALVMETGRHPDALKDAVCSPGGTTIEGVRSLEEAGFRGAVMDAVIASYEKTLKLKK